MTDVYDPVADYSRSWHVGVTAARYRHRAIVRLYLPALRQARYKQRLSVKRLALEIGVTKSTLQGWENCYGIPPPDLFERWRDRLGVWLSQVAHHAIVKFYLPALRRARHEQGFTIERLALAMGVPWWTMRAWEKGYWNPPPHLFDRWRNLMRV